MLFFLEEVIKTASLKKATYVVLLGNPAPMLSKSTNNESSSQLLEVRRKCAEEFSFENNEVFLCAVLLSLFLQLKRRE